MSAAKDKKAGGGIDFVRVLRAVPRNRRLAAAAIAPGIGKLALECGDPVTTANVVATVTELILATTAGNTTHTRLAAATIRGMAEREELKQAEGGSISAGEAALQLGISKPAVLKRYHNGQLVGWREARQDSVRFPVWQFRDDNILPGLSGVLAVLRQAPWMDDWARVLFFLNRRSSMKNRRPLDLLREGKQNPVLAAARAAVEQ